MTKGLKRGTVGDEDEKNIIEGVEIGDEEAKKLEIFQRDIARIEVSLDRKRYRELRPALKKRREILKAIPRFWSVALMRHAHMSLHIAHSADQSALVYLEDVWVEHDQLEPRAFKLEFHFGQNPYFSNSVLSKEYKYIAPSSAADDQPDENGVTETMVDFSWDRDIQLSHMKIDWKNDDKNLTKMYPREVDPDDEDSIAEPGSFFNFFEQESDPMDIGVTIATEIFPDAIEYFLGKLGGEELDSEDEDEDEDDEEEDEIDLEKPRSKKRRV